MFWIMSFESLRCCGSMGPNPFRSQLQLGIVLALGLGATWAFAEPDAASQAGVHTVQARVVDANSAKGVPYVNVGIPLAGLGTVSGEDGRFELSGASADAILVFAAIGYETLSLPFGSLPEDGRIPLTPVEIGFREEISVTAEPAGDPRVLGKQLKERGYGFGFGSGRLGAEIGARIRIRGTTYIESANFTVAHTGGERFLYRVNIYDFAGNEIGQNLLQRNVIVAAKQERGTLSVDLREHGLILQGDVLLALEWIRDDRDIGNANVMFRAKPRSRANLYFKATSHLPFQKVPRHGLGFYLLGYPLD